MLFMRSRTISDTESIYVADTEEVVWRSIIVIEKSNNTGIQYASF
jgi:hypothetical protein